MPKTILKITEEQKQEFKTLAEEVERGMVCTEACEGIKDPIAAIKTAKEALRRLADRWNTTREWHEMDENNSAWLADIHTTVQHCKQCADALALLEGK